MKKRNFAYALLSMALASCVGLPDPEPPPPPAAAVEEKYWFAEASWATTGGGDEGRGAAALSGDTFTVTAASASYNFSYTGVYTEGGGDLNGIAWTYLYDGSGKIGYAAVDSENVIIVMLGKKEVTDYSAEATPGIDIDTTDMQDSRNGMAAKDP